MRRKIAQNHLKSLPYQAPQKHCDYGPSKKSNPPKPHRPFGSAQDERKPVSKPKPKNHEEGAGQNMKRRIAPLVRVRPERIHKSVGQEQVYASEKNMAEFHLYLGRIVDDVRTVFDRRNDTTIYFPNLQLIA